MAVDITDKDFVKFVARDSGPINVYAKDTVTGEDELKSTHTTVRKAQQKAGNLALAAAFENPAVKIRYEKHEVVDVTINAQDITMQVEAPSGVLNPLLTNYTMVAEPGSYGLSGALAGTTVVQPSTGDYTFRAITMDDLNLNDSWGPQATINASRSVLNEANWAQGQVSVSNDQSYSGSQSYKCHIVQGATLAGFDIYGTQNGVPSNGKTFQLQLKTFFPTGYDFTNTQGNGLKFIGFSILTNGTTPQRVWFKIDGGSGSGMHMEREQFFGQATSYFTQGTSAISTNTWQTWTWECTWSVTAGVGRIRMWGAGGNWGPTSQLLFDSLTNEGPSGPYPTLKTTSDTGGEFIKHIAEWNSGGAANQVHYVDDIYLTDKAIDPLPFTGSVPDVI